MDRTQIADHLAARLHQTAIYREANHFVRGAIGYALLLGCAGKENLGAPGFDAEKYASRLDPAHESLKGLGVAPETLQLFKAGYASTGVRDVERLFN